MESQNKTAQNHNFFRALFAAILTTGTACIADSALAEGWYVGASSAKVEDRNWCDRNLGACDDKDSGWKVFVGNQLNRFVGFEFGYNDLGQMTDTGVTTESDGFVVSLVGMIPVGDMFSITGRVGTFHWNSEISSSNPALAGDRKSTNLTVGIGANVAMGRRFSLRVEWEHYDVNEDDISLLSAGVAYSFGK
ncbi:MAG: outer membrane beta-barrel protein [Pseudomonadota bacterium]